MRFPPGPFFDVGRDGLGVVGDAHGAGGQAVRVREGLRDQEGLTRQHGDARRMPVRADPHDVVAAFVSDGVSATTEVGHGVRVRVDGAGVLGRRVEDSCEGVGGTSVGGRVEHPVDGVPVGIDVAFVARQQLERADQALGQCLFPMQCRPETTNYRGPGRSARGAY